MSESTHFTPFIKWGGLALAGVAQWIESWSVNQKVTGSILSQGTCPGPGPQLEVSERQPMDVSLARYCFSPFLSPPFLSL